MINNSSPTIVDDHKQPDSPPNRGYDNKRLPEGYQDIKVELQDIDLAIITYINDQIKPWVTQDDNRVVVPVMYASPERWKSIKKDGVFRDNAGRIQLPLMVTRRTGMKKNGLNIPVNRYLSRGFSTPRWNGRNAYDRFSVVNGINPSQEYMMVVYPDYYDITYECILWTAFQSQMNQTVEQISFEVENYWGPRNGYKFKTSVDEYTMDIELPTDNDRLVKTTFNMIVKAYILPEDKLNAQGSPEILTKNVFSAKKIVIEERFIGE